MESEKKEIKDEACPGPIKPENEKEQNISKINKILSDNTVTEKVFDLLFVIDATGSMSSYINAAKDETENISKELRNLYPEYHFQYGYIFYRDPIDSNEDQHEIIDLTDQVNSLPEQIKKIRAYGGGDLPEDWVGAFKLVNEKINWRNGVRVIIHLADAGAHGKEFTLSDKYPEESEKLKNELLKCCEKGIKVFGYVITEDARNSFNQCQNLFRSNGGSYEICEFKIAEELSDSEKYEAKYEKKRKKCCSEKMEYKKEDSDDENDDENCDENCDENYDEDEEEKRDEDREMERKCERSRKCEEAYFDEEEDIYDFYEDVEDKIISKQDKINSEFRKKVIDTVTKSLY